MDPLGNRADRGVDQADSKAAQAPLGETPRAVGAAKTGGRSGPVHSSDSELALRSVVPDSVISHSSSGKERIALSWRRLCQLPRGPGGTNSVARAPFGIGTGVSGVSP